MKKEPLIIEQGALRPPSEKDSFFLRVVRNCPWNKCKFCPAYKGEKFSLRKSDEIIEEIKQLKKDTNSQKVQNIFLQDGDALSLPVEELKKILVAIREALPLAQRITAYARSSMLINRSVEDLKKLKSLGLSRIHVGFESGSNSVLEFMHKGTTAEKQLEGCLRVKEAGMELCTYVMPGLGGKALSESHVLETAKMIKRIEPDHIRFRTCFVLENTPLAEEYLNGNFEPLSEEETVWELQAFLNQVKGISTRIISDHRINLLFELQGSLREDYETMENIVNRFLKLNEEEKSLFIAGRRLRIIKSLDEIDEQGKRAEIIRRFGEYQAKLPVSQEILF